MHVFSIARWLAISLAVVSVTIVGCGGVGANSSDEEPDASQDTTVVAQATFEGKEGQSASGTYRILRVGKEDLRLVFAEDFRVDEGPDLHVVLSPKGPDEASGENVMDGEAVRVEKLEKASGHRSYDLQDDLDLATFNTVAIQCIEYSHLFAAAPIK